MIINDIISYQMLSMSEVIEYEDFVVFLWRIKYIRTIKCNIISSTWTNGVKAKEFSRWEP